MTKAPAAITYASVVSRETICIALLMAVLNDLNVKVGDVLNAYITAPITKKVWTVLGPEFSIDASKSAIIVHALWIEECWCCILRKLGFIHAPDGLHILQS
jgi:hypothetical protein